MAISGGVHGGHSDLSLVTRKKYTINTILIYYIYYIGGFLLSVTNDSLESFLFSPHLEGQVRHDPDFGKKI